MTEHIVRIRAEGQICTVKRVYGLTVDRREAASLERNLSGCASMAMESIAARQHRRQQGTVEKRGQREGRTCALR